jgi:hypothetical protein
MIYTDNINNYNFGDMFLRGNRLFLIAFILFGLIILSPIFSHAASYNPGDPCSTAGAMHQVNDASGMDFLVCDGSNWQSSLYFPSIGGLGISSLTGQPAPQSPQFSSSALNDLTDVDTTGVGDGEILMYSAGVSGWVPGTGGGGGGTPGGLDTQIQFNDGGAFGGDAQLVWNKTTNTLTLDGYLDYTGAITDISDRRKKENITPLENALEGLMALQAYSFTMKGDESRAVEYGLMAQDVLPVFPELVKTKENGVMTLNYIGLIAPMVEAMKAQQDQIESLQATNKSLEDRLEIIEKHYKTGE